MPLPPLVVSGQVIAASHINAIRNYLPLMADGSAATPGFRFEDDPDTGLHRPGSNQLAIVTGGVIRLTVSDTAITTGLEISAGVSRIGDGTAGAPGLRFEADPDTGVHRSGSNQFAIVTGGSVRVKITDTGAGFWVDAAKIGTVSTPSTNVARVLGSLHLGGASQGGNEDGLMQLGSFAFASGNNWGAVSGFGLNFALKSTAGSDIRYTPITHASAGYAGIECSPGVVRFAVETSIATTAGATITPFYLMEVGAAAIKMFLGGTLKTLSVDGSGFVKAT